MDFFHQYLVHGCDGGALFCPQLELGRRLVEEQLHAGDDPASGLPGFADEPGLGGIVNRIEHHHALAEKPGRDRGFAVIGAHADGGAIDDHVDGPLAHPRWE